MKIIFIIFSFLTLCNFTFAADICEDSSTAKQNINQLKSTAHIMKTQFSLAKSCENIPENERTINPHSYTSPNELSEISKISESCISSKVSQLFKIGLINTMKPNWNKFRDPWGTVDTLKEIEKRFIINEKETSSMISSRIVQARFEKLSSNKENFECYNLKKVSELVCSSFGQNTETAIEELIGAPVLAP